MARRSGPGALMLAATVSRRFYINGESKSHIADELGISRFQVARLLELAVEEGVIRFHIEPPGAFDDELSEAVRKRFGLLRAVVIDIPDPELTAAILRQRVGHAAAAVLSESVTEHDVLGIGWGRTLTAMARELTEIARCPVVQMVGVTGSVHDNSIEIVRQVSAVGRGRAYPLYVPLVLGDEQAVETLQRQPGIADAVKLFDSITIAAVAIGSWDPPDSQMLDALPPKVGRRLTEEGVVGEICATLLREDGTTLDTLQSRSITVNVEQLRRIRDVIVVGGGAHKARAVLAAIRARLTTTLVTDRTLAVELLRLADAADEVASR